MPDQRALILCGHGRYEDPWHDHAAIACELAHVLEELDVEPVIRSMFTDSADDLDQFDLLIVNGSRGRRDHEFDGTDDDWLPLHEKVYDYAKSGKPILLYHVGINAFTDSPYWDEICGGKWIRGKTHHPKISDAEFIVQKGSHPIVEGLEAIHVFDERYTYLETQDHVTIYLKQFEYGEYHASAWVNEADGMRVVFDSLGHQPQALHNEQRRDLLVRELNWLLER